MRISFSRSPDLQTLTFGLNAIFRSNGYADSQVSVLKRKRNSYVSTFPNGIVACRFNDGSELRLFYKYGVSPNHNATYGHRGGIAYEAAVYRHILQLLQVSMPTFYGAYTDITTGKTLLILEYLHNSAPIIETPEPAAALNSAAHWIGQFHAANEARLSRAPMPFLHTYNAAYYLAWAHRTSLFAGHLHRRFPWLATLCKRFEEFVPALLAPPPTVIHGEYTPANVLVRDGIIYPIDWESAAIAMGEIDLAILTDGG